jgi:hypothetical protein
MHDADASDVPAVNPAHIGGQMARPRQRASATPEVMTGIAGAQVGAMRRGRPAARWICSGHNPGRQAPWTDGSSLAPAQSRHGKRTPGHGERTIVVNRENNLTHGPVTVHGRLLAADGIRAGLHVAVVREARFAARPQFQDETAWVVGVRTFKPARPPRPTRPL